MEYKPEQSKTINSRRKFLKKTSAGALISALPAQSVWGACTVSGALSGNGSRVSEDCSILPYLYGGRSHGSWKQIFTHQNKVRNMFKFVQDEETHSAQRRANAEDAIKCEIRPIIDNTSFDLGDGTILKITDVHSSGLMMQLATVYLNYVFKFYPRNISVGAGPTIITNGTTLGAEELVKFFYAVSLANPNYQFSDNDFGYSSGVSDFVPSQACIVNPNP